MKAKMKKLFLFLIIIAIIFTAFSVYLNQNYATPIFMYHSFNKAIVKTYAAVDPAVFYKQMNFIKKSGYKVISLDEYCQLLKNKKSIPKKSIVITIDDGDKDNLKAIRILKEFDYPATIFVIQDRIGTEGYLSKENIAHFLKNTKIKIGSHTSTHAYLPDINKDEIKKEISVSKTQLGKLFSQDIEALAYPVGGFTKEILEETKKAGYLCACTTNRGFSKLLNPFALRRIKITNRDLGIRLWAKLSGFYNIFKKPKKPY